MGTNYYWHEKPACPTCAHEGVSKHIGKSSLGWCFTLHVEPENGINDLEDWERLWEMPGSYIRDEYGTITSVDKMLSVITERSRSENWDKAPLGYESWQDFHSLNQSERGPKGLLRHQINGWNCVKHGAGTWDCIIGEFS